jgi:hypothetical protein
MVARCERCKTEKEVFWHKGAATRVTPKNAFEAVIIQLAASDAIPLDEDFEFDDDQLPQEIISLPVASGHSAVKKQFSRYLVQCVVTSAVQVQFTLAIIAKRRVKRPNQLANKSGVGSVRKRQFAGSARLAHTFAA